MVCGPHVLKPTFSAPEMAPGATPEGGYSQLVSAALVTVKSSGSLVAGLLALRSICTLIDEPVGGGAVTELKSGPSTT